MNENNEIYMEAVTGSVSDNEISANPSDNADALPDIPTDSVVDDFLEALPDETESDIEPEPETVSGSDVRTFSEASSDTVSAGDIYNISYETMEEVSIWEKPISDYTVSEGLLLLIFILLLVGFCIRCFKSN